MNLARALPLLVLVACDAPSRDLANGGQAAPVEQAPAEQAPAGRALPVEAGARDFEESLRALLRAPDVVIDEERLAAIGPPAEIAAAFERLLADPRISRYEQTRVVSALRVLDDPRAEIILEGVLRNEATSLPVRRVALKSYAHRAKARALPLLLRFAADDDRHTREAVIRAIGSIEGEEAARALAQRVEQDPAPDLRALAARLASGSP